MSTYADLAQSNDPLLRLTEADLVAADGYVNALLYRRGYDPSAVVLPNGLLAQIAIHRAFLEVATRSLASGQDTQMAEKAKLYRQLLLDEEALLSGTLLGVSARAGTTLFSVAIERL